MTNTSELELIQAEIKYIELRLEVLRIQETKLIQQRGEPDYSNNPYLPR